MRDDRAQRYRRAAELSLEQLDWCIQYLRSNQKRAVARALSRNREIIRRRLRRADLS